MIPLILTTFITISLIATGINEIRNITNNRLTGQEAKYSNSISFGLAKDKSNWIITNGWELIYPYTNCMCARYPIKSMNEILTQERINNYIKKYNQSYLVIYKYQDLERKYHPLTVIQKYYEIQLIYTSDVEDIYSITLK